MRDSSKARQSEGADFAQSLAVSALVFFAADPERLSRFLDLTGLGPESLRKAAADPAFLGSVLEYLVADEQLLLRFAADADVDPETVARARQSLAGAVDPGEP